jgi:hypothetical protein
VENDGEQGPSGEDYDFDVRERTYEELMTRLHAVGDGLRQTQQLIDDPARSEGVSTYSPRDFRYLPSSRLQQGSPGIQEILSYSETLGTRSQSSAQQFVTLKQRRLYH